MPVRTPTPSRRRMASRARKTTRTLVCRAGTAHLSTSVAARSPAALALRPPFRSTACVCVNRRFPSLTCVCPEPVLAAGLFFRAMLACISAGALAAAQRRRRHARRPGEARSDHRQHRRDADAHAALLLRRMGRRLMLPADESCGARRGQSADAFLSISRVFTRMQCAHLHKQPAAFLASELNGRWLAGSCRAPAPVRPRRWTTTSLPRCVLRLARCNLAADFTACPFLIGWLTPDPSSSVPMAIVYLELVLANRCLKWK